MSQANVELVRQGYELFAAGEYEAVAALMAPEAEVGDSGGLALPGSAAGSREGPDGFLRSAGTVLGREITRSVLGTAKKRR